VQVIALAPAGLLELHAPATTETPVNPAGSVIARVAGVLGSVVTSLKLITFK
jgi:hypothetical protein